MSRKTSLLKNTGIFAVGNLGSKLLMFLIIPFFTYYIAPEGMGRYDVLYVIIQLLQTVVVLAIPESLFRWLLDLSSSEDRERVIATWVRLFLILLVIFSIVYAVVTSIMKIEDACLIYLLILTGSIYVSLQFLTRGFHNNALFAWQGIVYALVYCTTSAILVIGLSVDYIGLLLGMLAGNIACSALMIIKQRTQIIVRFDLIDKRIQKQMLSYSVMMLPNTLSWWFVSSFGRIVILFSLGSYANGIYAIASRFPSVLNIFSTIFQQAWNEHAVGEYNSRDRDEYFAQIFDMYSRAMISVAIFLIPATKLVIDIFLFSSYHEASNYLGFLYLGAVFAAFSYFFGTDYICRKDTKGAAVTTLLGAATTIVLTLVLIRYLGIHGVTIGLCAGQFVIWLLRYRDYQKHCVIHIKWPILLPLIMAAIAYSAVMPFASLSLSGALSVLAVGITIIFNRETILLIWNKMAGRLKKQ